MILPSQKKPAHKKGRRSKAIRGKPPAESPAGENPVARELFMDNQNIEDSMKATTEALQRIAAVLESIRDFQIAAFTRTARDAQAAPKRPYLDFRQPRVDGDKMRWLGEQNKGAK